MTEILTPREIARLITEGKLPPQFIGVKSFAVLKQEIFSLVNRYNPKTMSEFEKTVYQKDLAATVEGILKQKQNDQEKLFKMFYNTYETDAQKDLEKKEEMKSELQKSAFVHITKQPKTEN